MSTNAILQSTQQVTRNRSLTVGATIKVLRFFTGVIRFVATVIRSVAGVIMFVAEMIARLRANLECRSSIPRPDDIFVVTYPRSGTTWVQMILYQLFTDGEMDFAHIQEWSPYYEDWIIDDRSFEHLPSPRVFKSHLKYKRVPKVPCKYIYVVRNGKDVALSLFHFSRTNHILSLTHRNFMGDFGEFFELFLKGKVVGSWFKHVSQWWENRQNLNVLFLTYEELTSNREQAIRKIIDFCGKEVEPETFSRIVERSSFAFMKQHEDKFDPIIGTLVDRGMKTGNFIRKGEVGGWKEYLSSEQEELFQRRFTKHLNMLSAELKDIIK